MTTGGPRLDPRWDSGQCTCASVICSTGRIGYDVPHCVMDYRALVMPGFGVLKAILSSPHRHIMRLRTGCYPRRITTKEKEGGGAVSCVESSRCRDIRHLLCITVMISDCAGGRMYIRLDQSKHVKPAATERVKAIHEKYSPVELEAVPCLSTMSSRFFLPNCWS